MDKILGIEAKLDIIKKLLGVKKFNFRKTLKKTLTMVRGKGERVHELRIKVLNTFKSITMH